MRTALLASLLLALATASPLAAATPIDVTLEVTLGHHALPAYRSCALTLPAGSTAAEALDAAVEEGCISSWEYQSYTFTDEDGNTYEARYVSAVDGVPAVAGTFWALYVNEALSETGVDDTVLGGGDVLELVYADWFTPWLVG